MPELPEVETMRRALAPWLTGASLSDVQLHRADLRRPFPERFARRLDGAVVSDIVRRGKYLLIHLDTGEIWVTHLGMTGHFDMAKNGEGGADTKRAKYLHFQCTATTRTETFNLYFYDQRRFGFMLLIAEDVLPSEDWYSELGVEPLSENFNARYLLDRAAVRKSSLKALMMDQGVIAGLGNIYSCEALWQSRLHPRHSAQTLTEEQASTLVGGVKSVLTEALCVGSASIGQRGEVGRDGYFAHQYKAYDRFGEPCPRDDGGLIRKVYDRGRSSFYCPVCQI